MADGRDSQIDLVPFAAVDPPTLVGLINRAYLRYEILVAPRISLEGFFAEAPPGSEFLLARQDGGVVACAMVCPADVYYEASRLSAPTKPDWLPGEEGSASEVEQPDEYAHKFAGDLGNALYYGLAAVEPERQSSGWGSALVGRTEALARERGRRRVVLTTLREFGLVEYYHRFGYVVVDGDRYPAGHWSVVVPHEYCYLEKRL